MDLTKLDEIARAAVAMQNFRLQFQRFCELNPQLKAEDTNSAKVLERLYRQLEEKVVNYALDDH